MADICKMRIKIADNPTYGIDSYGFYLAKSPSEVCCDPKDSNIIITDFPEVDGDSYYIPAAVAKKSFDYPISLIFFDNNLNSANKKISAFYNSLLGKKITIYNDFKGVKVVGYVKSYKAGDFHRDDKDIVLFDITFYIPKPQDCDFDYVANKIYFGDSYNDHDQLNDILPECSSRPFDIVVRAGAINVTFGWESSLGDPISVIYNELGYDVKSIFDKTISIVDIDGTQIEYNVFTYTPIKPFSKQVTYTIR